MQKSLLITLFLLQYCVLMLIVLVLELSGAIAALSGDLYVSVSMLPTPN